MWILGGTMIGEWFAFIMQKQWGDLRKLIDARMQLDGNQGPPRSQEEFLLKVLLCIARDMDALHTKHDIIHRDLKASNILLWSLGESLPCDNPHVKANVADYECSVGVVGTRFWRAPEILQQLKDGVRSSELVFTKAADVYSYGMVCYELLSGRIPYEESPPGGSDVVLSGGRPLGLPRLDFLIYEAEECFQTRWSEQVSQEYYEGTQDPVPSLDPVPSVKCGLYSVMQFCWNHEPLERPTFSEIVKLLESKSLKTTRVQRMRFRDSREPVGYLYHVTKVMKTDNTPRDFCLQSPVGMLLNASKERVEGPLMWGPDRSFISYGVEFMMPRQWGDLRKLIDEKMQLNGWRGSPEFEEAFLLKVMLCVARDMDTLHTKYEIIHRNLNSSNILVWSLGEGLPCDDPHVRAFVLGLECSVERTDLAFGRVPEIRQQLRDGVQRSELVITKAADVYSYGAVCYDLLTGRDSFGRFLAFRWDILLFGDRLDRVWGTAKWMEQNAMDYFRKRLLEQGDSEACCKVTKDSLPSFCFSSNVRTALFSVMLSCWNDEPSERPTFSEIVELLESWKV